MKDGTELYNELREFSGCGDQVYRHSLVKSFHYTEGVQFFMQKAQAYWFLDIMATEPKIRKHVDEMGFALVLLKVNGDKARITVADDTDTPPIFKRDIDYTDCPEAPVTERNKEGAWKFYIEQTMVGNKVVPIMLLPNER